MIFVSTHYFSHYDYQLFWSPLSSDIIFQVVRYYASYKLSYREIEEYLRNSGINYSIVRPVEFMNNVSFYRKQIMTGTYYDPRDAGKSHQWIAASDIGFFVGEMFDGPDEWIGKALDIAGDELTIAEYVDALSATLGVNVHHQQISWETYEKEAGEEMTIMVRWFDKKGYSVDVEALRQKYPDMLTYEQYLQSLDWN